MKIDSYETGNTTLVVYVDQEFTVNGADFTADLQCKWQCYDLQIVSNTPTRLRVKAPPMLAFGDVDHLALQNAAGSVLGPLLVILAKPAPPAAGGSWKAAGAWDSFTPLKQSPFGAGAVVDGDVATRWMAPLLPNQTALVIDLGQEGAVSKIRIKHALPVGVMQRFDIATSNDQKTWTTRAIGATGTGTTASEHPLTNVNARYYRLLFQSVSRGAVVAVAEMELVR